MSAPDTNPVSTDALGAGSEPALGTPSSTFLVPEHNDPKAWLRMVEEAGRQGKPEAIQALCNVVLLPTNRRLQYRRRHPAWCQVRTAAVQSLQEIGDESAIPILAHCLLTDPAAEVRGIAAAALYSFGSVAVPTLCDLLQRPCDWTLEGMIALITLLGDLRDTTAGPSLAHVLFGDLPLGQERLVGRPVRRALRLTVGLILSLWLIGLASAGVDVPDAAAALFLGCFCAFLPIFGFCYLCVSLPIGAMIKREKRESLVYTAAEALAKLQDKKSLPSVIEATFGSLPYSERAGIRQTLRALLPLLGPEDAPMMASYESYLLGALDPVTPRMTIAILRALEQVGSGQAAVPVERLLRRRPTLEIKAEAMRILPLLQERKRKEQAATILLRASEAPAATPEQLLRPAVGEPETPAEQLLRPRE